ncbi:MAG: hypothetical protein AAF569_04090 [Pseudomonadota bacterium]
MRKTTLSSSQKDMVYGVTVSKLEQRDMEKVFARVFSSDDGKKALAYLQMITFQRALNGNAPDEQLRYMEGQRSLVATILRLIDRGRNG